MTVFTITIVDQTFDKKSSEAAYLARVLSLVALKLQSNQGTLTGSQNVLGTNAAGVANTVVATFTHSPSGSNP
jgi:hypothetical protein